MKKWIKIDQKDFKTAFKALKKVLNITIGSTIENNKSFENERHNESGEIFDKDLENGQEN